MLVEKFKTELRKKFCKWIFYFAIVKCFKSESAKGQKNCYNLSFTVKCFQIFHQPNVSPP